MMYKKTLSTVSFNNCFIHWNKKSDVLNVILNLKDETVAEWDGVVSDKILKHEANDISLLTHIYNLSIKNCIFPGKFKLVVIKLLFKNGYKLCINYCRPISILSDFLKILEKIIKNRLIEYLEKFKLLSKNQFGFSLGLGTENALYRVKKVI